MKNLLFSEEYETQYPDRCTGRTTAEALSVISQAIINYGKLIPINDHYGTFRTDEYLAYRIKDIIGMLGLKYMTIERRSNEFFLVSRHIVSE